MFLTSAEALPSCPYIFVPNLRLVDMRKQRATSEGAKMNYSESSDWRDRAQTRKKACRVHLFLYAAFIAGLFRPPQTKRFQPLPYSTSPCLLHCHSSTSTFNHEIPRIPSDPCHERGTSTLHGIYSPTERHTSPTSPSSAGLFL